MTSNTEWLRKHMEPGDMLMSEVADALEVSVSTVRRAKDEDGVKAPSKEYAKGGYKAYVYTPDDLKELRDHFSRTIRNRAS